MEWLFIIGFVIYVIINSGKSDSTQTKKGRSSGDEWGTKTPDLEHFATARKKAAELREQYGLTQGTPKSVEKLQNQADLKTKSAPTMTGAGVSTGMAGVKKISPASKEPLIPAISDLKPSSELSSTKKLVETSMKPQYDSTLQESSAVVSKSEAQVSYQSAHDDLLSAYANYEKSSKVPTYSRNDSAYLKAESFLNEQGIHSFWHMTHWNNLQSILRQGILNHDLARLGKKVVDISESTVQDRRMALEPKYGRSIHDYAPLYINQRNPMLYRRKDLSQDLCLIEISLDVLREIFAGRLVFTDGNAASKSTSFYSDLADLHRLPWDVLTNEYWNEFQDGKRKRCAEILVHQHISNKLITGIHVTNSSRAGGLLVGNKKWVVQYSPQLFFRN